MALTLSCTLFVFLLSSLGLTLPSVSSLSPIEAAAEVNGGEAHENTYPVQFNR
jgi:hypothetical protein